MHSDVRRWLLCIHLYCVVRTHNVSTLSLTQCQRLSLAEGNQHTRTHTSKMCVRERHSHIHRRKPTSVQTKTNKYKHIHDIIILCATENETQPHTDNAVTWKWSEKKNTTKERREKQKNETQITKRCLTQNFRFLFGFLFKLCLGPCICVAVSWEIIHDSIKIK